MKGKKAKVMEDGREALIGRARQGEGGRHEKSQINMRPNTLKLFCWEFSIVSFTVRTLRGEEQGEAGRRETAEDGPCFMVLLLHHGRWW